MTTSPASAADLGVRAAQLEGVAEMLRFKTDAIILKDVVCGSRYAYCRRFCPRAIPPYWREIWLERADGQHDKTGSETGCDHS